MSLNCATAWLARFWHFIYMHVCRYLCLYCTSMPSETAARIWDALLLEGSKILNRVALAFLSYNQAAFLSKDNAGEQLLPLFLCSLCPILPITSAKNAVLAVSFMFSLRVVIGPKLF